MDYIITSSSWSLLLTAKCKLKCYTNSLETSGICHFMPNCWLQQPLVSTSLSKQKWTSWRWSGPCCGLPAPLVSHNQLLTCYSLQETLRGQQSQPDARQQLRQMQTPTFQVISNPPHHRVKHNLPRVTLPANINLSPPTLHAELPVVTPMC